MAGSNEVNLNESKVLSLFFYPSLCLLHFVLFWWSKLVSFDGFFVVFVFWWFEVENQLDWERNLDVFGGVLRFWFGWWRKIGLGFMFKHLRFFRLYIVWYFWVLCSCFCGKKEACWLVLGFWDVLFWSFIGFWDHITVVCW